MAVLTLVVTVHKWGLGIPLHASEFEDIVQPLGRTFVIA